MNVRPFDDFVAATNSAMVVVTVGVGEERGGCLVGFHSQASIDPPRYAVWLSKQNRTARLADKAEHLAVHLLADDQHDLAELFGGTTGDDREKLVHTTWEAGPGGVPLLLACSTRFVGRVVERHRPGGDHHCFLLELVDASEGSPVRPLRLTDALDIDPGHEP